MLVTWVLPWIKHSVERIIAKRLSKFQTRDLHFYTGKHSFLIWQPGEHWFLLWSNVILIMLVLPGITACRKYQKKSFRYAQYKLIRFVFGLGPRSYLNIADFQRIGWLPVEQRVWQTGINHVFKILNGLTAPYLHQDLTRVADLHSYNTRSSQQGLVVPRVGSHGQKTFYYNAIKQWNQLPLQIQSIPTFSRFKPATKRHLLAYLQTRESDPRVFY